MTADYNGWTDAPEAEREAMEVYSHQELEREALAQREELQKSGLQLMGSGEGAEGPVSCVPEEINRVIHALPEAYRTTYGNLRPAA
jgi:hypothetical protein